MKVHPLPLVLLLTTLTSPTTAEVYSWEDKDGIHMVDDISKVPKKYRSKDIAKEPSGSKNWTRIGSNAESVYYIDSTTIEYYRGKPSAWFKVVDRGTDKTLTTRFVANCGERRLFSVASGRSERNRIVENSAYYDNPIEIPVSPDSVSSQVYDILCQK